MTYPLFIFLPEYLISRGADFGETSAYTTWRNFAITKVCSVPGPLIAGALSRVKVIGQKYTMVIGALISSKFKSRRVSW